MLLRRLEVFFIILLLVTTGYHLMKRQDKARQGVLLELKPRLPLLRTPVLLGFGPIHQGRGQGRKSQRRHAIHNSDHIL